MRAARPDAGGERLAPAGPEQAPVRRADRVLAFVFAALTVLAVAAALVLVRPGHPTALVAAPRTTAPTASLPAPVLPGVAAGASSPAPAGVAAALSGLLTDPRLGGHVTASVQDVATGNQLFARAAAEPAVPASTAKLATAIAVLAARGPAYRLQTRAVAGPAPGEVVLVGGGDPTLAVGATGSYPEAARLDQLAAQVRIALGGTAPTRVLVDSSLYPGPQTGPQWYPADVAAGYVSHITPLMTNGARIDPRHLTDPSPRYGAPDLAAGAAFARALGLPAGAVARGRAAQDAAPLGTVSSPPMVRLVEDMLSASDNVVAETLARQVALAAGQPASFAGAARAVTAKLTELGLPVDGVTIVDGSGLSMENRLTARLLSGILAVAARPDRPTLRGLFTGLPVAAYSGTLKDRYRSANAGGGAAGTVRAKTGTLDGVSSLAGIVVDADGRLLVFAVMSDRVPVGGGPGAQAALDRIGAALAGCGCR